MRGVVNVFIVGITETTKNLEPAFWVVMESHVRAHVINIS